MKKITKIKALRPFSLKALHAYMPTITFIKGEGIWLFIRCLYYLQSRA